MFIILCRSILKQLQLDNRKVFIVGICMGIAGSVTMSDWQSIGNDPCLQVTTERVNLASNESLYDSKTDLPVFSESATHTALAYKCEQLSTAEYKCYWNPKSRITGKICKDCYAICRSIEKSLNFIQFSVGLALFLLCIILTTTPLYVIGSDFVPVESQVCGSLVPLTPRNMQ